MKYARALVVVALSASPMFAHGGGSLHPDDLWTTWEFDPGVVLPLAVSALLYAVGSQRHVGLRQWQKLCFWVGWLSLVIALVSPLHPLGDVLFSAHMIQHEVLMLISAPFLVLSKPLVTFLWAVPYEWRRTLGQASKARPVRRSWTTLTDPFTAWWLHAAAIWVWHAPPLFNATLTNDWIHSAQHISFLGTALLFWWALFYAHGRKSHGAGVVYVFTTALHTGILGALLTFSPKIWYAGYATTTQAWGLTPLQDQQIGGLIMWVPASLIYIGAGLYLFAAWMKESDAMVGRASHAQ